MAEFSITIIFDFLVSELINLKITFSLLYETITKVIFFKFKIMNINKYT